MKITIKRLSTPAYENRDALPEAIEWYKVIDCGREFEITLEPRKHGSSSLRVVGLEGILYTDKDDNTVRRQVITVGRSCGVTIDADELVEGLSVLAVRGVILANRKKGTGEITIMTHQSANGGDRPQVLVDGRQVEVDLLY